MDFDDIITTLILMVDSRHCDLAETEAAAMNYIILISSI